MATLEKVFQEYEAKKITENGDESFSSTLNPLLDILFMTEYYKRNLIEVNIGKSSYEKLFSMFIRDPRYGLGQRDLGRELMRLSEVPMEDVVRAGRVDDIFFTSLDWKVTCDYLYNEIKNGNELVKKWMPRSTSKKAWKKAAAYTLMNAWGMNKQQYGKFIKCNTTENKLSRKATKEIDFSKIPSLAMLKYFKRFSTGKDTCMRFAEYLDKVRGGEKKMNVSTTTVYDIYRNRDKIDAQLFFDQIEKISGSWIPIVDTSGSMYHKDAFGKAVSIGHYLAKCSTYAPNKAISFSSRPELLDLGTDGYYYREIDTLYTEDCSNTDFGAVMELLKKLTVYPEYLIVLSDMEFDEGSRQSKDELKELWKKNNCNTKIIWWNFNARNTTCPETDEEGNIFISGYNPMLLKFLENGFDGQKFLDKLIREYEKTIRNV